MVTLISKQIAIPNLRGEDDATRIGARISAKLEKVESVMEGRGDQHVEDLDRGESIRAPTQRHELIHATVLSVLVRPHYIARRRLRSIDDDDDGDFTGTNYGRVDFSPIARRPNEEIKVKEKRRREEN